MKSIGSGPDCAPFARRQSIVLTMLACAVVALCSAISLAAAPPLRAPDVTRKSDSRKAAVNAAFIRDRVEMRRYLPHTQGFQALQDPPALSELGRSLFFDTTLSTPVGQACSSCHAPQTGFHFPISHTNQNFGVPTGAIPKRVGKRAVPTVSYAKFIPPGPPGAHFLKFSELLFIGGMFWDGRALDLTHQATFPFQDPNEMNNLVHDVGSPELVVEKLQQSHNAAAFRAVFGDDIFSQPAADVFARVTQAIAAYEQTPQVSPFTSKFDYFIAGRTTLTDEELDGFRLFTGTWDGTAYGPPYVKNARCTLCHGIPDNPIDGPYLWTNFCYANIGVPKSARNPFYDQTDAAENPAGYNPQGRDFIDFGLGAFLYPLNGLPPGNVGEGSNGLGDFLAINGGFKAPTLRNVGKRPSPDFVKTFMHNGVFTTLKQVVHFYNVRNLTTVEGEVIDYSAENPLDGLLGTPLFPPPEVNSPLALINPSGITGEEGGELGNLGLNDVEEDHIVAFLETLSDGYFVPEFPAFTTQPTNRTVALGAAVTLTVAATGAPFPSFQWFVGDRKLEDVGFAWGTTTPTLHIDQVTLADAATGYRCVITNTAGSLSSTSASIRVRTPAGQPHAASP